MNLLGLLGIKPPAAAAIIGSGGKTSLMYALAKDAALGEYRVLTTTTTRIRPPTPDQSQGLILAFNDQVLHQELKASFRTQFHVTAARFRDYGNKLVGLAPSSVNRIFHDHLAEVVLVEADGARGLPLKACGEEEPVIPDCAGLVVLVVGLSGLGRPLNEQWVFRPEVFGRLAGLAPGAPVGPQDAARALFHPEGCLRDVPAAARVAVFLNQADTVSQAAAEAAAETFLAADPRVNGVVYGSLRQGRQTLQRLDRP